MSSPLTEQGVGSPTGADWEVARLAQSQRGVVDRSQLLAAGLSPAAIETRLRHGRLHRLHRGVYAVGHTALAPLAREQAALLAGGPGAAVSHRSAAALWGFCESHEGPVDITTGRRIRQPGITAHRSRIGSTETTVRAGLAVTSPARTLLDLAEVGSMAEVEEAVGAARVARWVTAETLLAYARASVGRRGVRVLTGVLEQAREEGFTRSRAERRLLALLRDAGLPAPEVNVVVLGRERDAVWRAERVIVELDSWAHHSSRTAFEADRLRIAELAAHGWHTVPVTWRQLTQGPYGVVARISAALAAPIGHTRSQWLTGSTPPAS
jgi:very-short-patch-repair endonuclease